ncbi:diacylglycerol kinase [Rhizobium sp. G187]|uniref:diacylglycerol kinase n=1 Tax=Rhizobium sp. G187 TaxID=3451352 RepID=UPI003EE5DB3C
MSTDTRVRYRKLDGFAHLRAAAGYSAGGLSRLWKEAAFRHEILAGISLAAIYGWLHVKPSIALAAVVLFLLLIAAEALNTAIEEIIDRISPEISETGRHAKDLGSLAVFCMIAANAVLLGYAVATFLLG